jgi:hypothetical protein
MNPLVAEPPKACTHCQQVKEAIHFRPVFKSKHRGREAYCEECRYQESLARSRELMRIRAVTKREVRERVRAATKVASTYVPKGPPPRPEPAPPTLIAQFMALCHRPGADANAPALLTSRFAVVTV